MYSSNDLAELIGSAIRSNDSDEAALAEASVELPIGPAAADGQTITEQFVRQRRSIVLTLEQALQHGDPKIDNYERVGRERAKLLRECSNTDELAILGGSRITIFAERLSVSWGYVDRMYSAPLIVPSETPVLYFALVRLDNSHGGNGLIRENHHSGYHYHYADAGKRRSDVLFTFGLKPPDPNNPVTWERHGEGHAAFSPQVSKWGFSKRDSVNRVCCANAAKLGFGAFKKPCAEAEFLLPM